MIRQAFSRAAAKPDGSSGNDFLEAILRERPDLKGQTAYFPGEGMAGHEGGKCAHTIFIGNEVFKGPKSKYGIEFIDCECQTLQQMERKNLPVPKVTYVGKKTCFFAMTRMSGVVLSSYNFMQEFSKEDICTLARDIAGFVVGMAQAFPLKDGMFNTHVDLHDGNILIDTKTKKLSAIIDFGIVGYRPKPEIHEALPQEFAQILEAEYALLQPILAAAASKNRQGIKGRLFKYLGFK